jgi:hypothetical protein
MRALGRKVRQGDFAGVGRDGVSSTWRLGGQGMRLCWKNALPTERLRRYVGSTQREHEPFEKPFIACRAQIEDNVRKLDFLGGS